jgi:hypothetical protein
MRPCSQSMMGGPGTYLATRPPMPCLQAPVRQCCMYTVWRWGGRPPPACLLELCGAGPQAGGAAGRPLDMVLLTIPPNSTP